ncbi:type II secretion system F family protein [Arthrobacter sp. AQ5-05]|uniref:type II secretion system F family protein n=1 Tax=Arthrobacter sp. AQ5-05 TaxID=2184581 RepID=UPI0025702E64|nr:type II secretion system F family protein [Arthrobacter sp. AQ5-05]
MSTTMILSLVLGLSLGSGLWLVLVRIPAMRPVTFAQRVAPHLRAGRSGSRMLNESFAAQTPFGPLGRILGPMLADVARLSQRLNPSNEAMARRLARAGLGISVLDFRAQQLLWSAGLTLAGAALLGANLVAGRFNPMFAFLVLVSCAVGGYLLRDWYLGEQTTRRSRRILAQFPTIAELMALAVAAGESTVGSIERVARTSRGALSEEFALTLAHVRAGATLAEALAEMSDRIQLTAMTRFVDAITVAAERGTPIAAVMRAQAQDVRDAAKRELMESAGKKEIGMMVPIVFGVLPLTIVFAVFPGLALIDMNY